MTTRHGQQASAGRLVTIMVIVAAAALLFSFFAQPLAFLLLLTALVMAVVVLVRVRRGRPGKGQAIATIVVSVLAMIIAVATSPATPPGVQDAAQGSAPTTTPPPPAPLPPPPTVDPNVLPAAVTVVTVQSPENLITADGRRLHVTMMQGHPAADDCQRGTDASTATTLVQDEQVRVAAPDAAHTDAAGVVPAGFQQVTMALADGRDYARTWAKTSAQRWEAACLTTTSSPTSTTRATAAPTTTAATPHTDVDRPFVPVPRAPARTHTGHSGHPCLPGERDGDHDGYCGE